MIKIIKEEIYLINRGRREYTDGSSVPISDYLIIYSIFGLKLYSLTLYSIGYKFKDLMFKGKYIYGYE